MSYDTLWTAPESENRHNGDFYVEIYMYCPHSFCIDQCFTRYRTAKRRVNSHYALSA